MMRRASWVVTALLLAACSGTTELPDAGVVLDAEAPDGGPVAIPARDDEAWRALPTLDRVGRPFVAELLVSDTATVSPSPREAYNALGPQAYTPGGQLHLVTAELPRRPSPAAHILSAVALFDGLDGACGVGHLTASSSVAVVRYQGLAGLLADDRIWLSTTSTCADLLGLERAAYGLGPVNPGCGGRRPGEDTLDVMLELLTTLPLSDGVATSSAVNYELFPYLAAP